MIRLDYNEISNKACYFVNNVNYKSHPFNAIFIKGLERRNFKNVPIVLHFYPIHL